MHKFKIIEEIKNKFCSISSELLDNGEVSEKNIEVLDEKEDERSLNKIIKLFI